MSDNTSQIVEIVADEQFLKNYQAVYYAMNVKPNCKSKLFFKNVVITIQDLKNLNYKVMEKLNDQFDNVGSRINVCVSFNDQSSIEFDNWVSFEKYNFNIEKSIDSILIVWEYNAKLPGYPLPQKHTLTVRIADELRPEEMINLVISGKLEEVDKLDQEICPILARVDFINSLLGDELLQIVELWQKGLLSPAVEDSKIYRKLNKYSRIIAYIINYVSVLLVIWLSIKYINNQINNMSIELLGQMPIGEFGNLFSKIVYLIIICYVFYKIFQIIANIVFSSLRSTNTYHTFDITNGDKVIYQEIEKTVKNKKLKIFGNIIFTFIFNIVCSIIANCLYE